jgi:serine protease AprX
MKKAVLIAIIIFCFMTAAQAQPGRYLIQLRDKAQNPFSLSRPEQFLSQRSIARRTRYNILYDSTDLPVTPAYVDSLRALASVTVLNVSKWLNQVSIQVTNSAVLDTINRFPFVQATTFIASRTQRSNRAPDDKLFKNKAANGIQALATTEQAFNYGAAAAQVNIHNGAFLHNMGLQGQGMIISLLDAGFYHYTSLKAFDSVNQKGQVLGTWDFVARDSSVVEDHPHGMECFSIIAANIPGTFVGTAPEAWFYLFRSEDAATEYPIEEHNWVCAAERVDSAGGDVISTSLGYSKFDDTALSHQYSDMNGNTTIAATGADLAAKKGILVVCAAGNEGASAWKYIVTPADADSVLTVGAVNAQGEVGAFSSYGPSADGRVKPDVVSVGVSTVLQGTGNTIITGNGTSFACPNMAGLATCLWQGFPEYTNMKMIDALRRSSNLFQTPTDHAGYGIPDMKKAVQLLLEDFATASVSDCKTLTWTSKDVSSMRYEIERQKQNESGFTKITEQSGTGTTFQTHSYEFTDSSLTIADGTARYRIRQVLDTSAAGFTAFYIETVTVSVALGCTPVPTSEKGVQIIPNPVGTSFHLKIESETISDLQFVLVNAIGQTVYTQHTAKPAGVSLFSIGTAGLAPGVYYLMLFNGGKRFVTKPFVKL